MQNEIHIRDSERLNEKAHVIEIQNNPNGSLQFTKNRYF